MYQKGPQKGPEGPQKGPEGAHKGPKTVSGPGKYPRIESNEAAGSTLGGALPSIPLSCSFATILFRNPKTLIFHYVLQESYR